MDYFEIMAKWDSQADEYNQWDNLSEIEKVEFAFREGQLAADDKA